MTRLRRIFFNALTVVSVLLLVGVSVLWVRSYWIQDQWNTRAGASYRCIYSEYGVVAAFTQNDPANSGEWPWKHWASHGGGVGGIPYGHFLFTRTSQGWWLSYASVFLVMGAMPASRGWRWVLYRTRVQRRARRMARRRVFPPYGHGISRLTFRFVCALALFSCVMFAVSMLVSIDFGLGRETTFSPLLDHAVDYRLTSGRGGVSYSWCRRSYYYQDAAEAMRSRGSASRDNQFHLRFFSHWFQGPYGGGESDGHAISFAGIKYSEVSTLRNLVWGGREQLNRDHDTLASVTAYRLRPGNPGDLPLVPDISDVDEGTRQAPNVRAGPSKT